MTKLGVDNRGQEELRDAFLKGMSHVAATVNVVTTGGKAGRMGVTVSAMSSVSADTPKPTLLVCVNKSGAAADIIRENGVFCVNILRDHQSYISDAFAGRYNDQLEDKFDAASWFDTRSGAPRLVDPLVAFACRIVSQDVVGTHIIFIGEVEEVFLSEPGLPLIYANRKYGSSSPIESSTEVNFASEAALDKPLSVGCFHSFGPLILPRVLAAISAQAPDLALNLVEGDDRRLRESVLSGETDLAILYDYGLDAAFDFQPLLVAEPYVLLPAAHPLAKQSEVLPADLRGLPMISMTAQPSRDYFESLLDSAGIKAGEVLRTSTLEMVRGMVGQNLGFAILMTRPAGDLSHDGSPLVALPLIADVPQARIGIAWRKDRDLPASALRFNSICASEMDQSQIK